LEVNEEAGVRTRIEKDLDLFKKNITSVKSDDKGMSRLIEMAKMYAQDSKSYLDKGDLFTSFSCISYAHGLLDAVRELTNSV
jgi:hypothetical protein